MRKLYVTGSSLAAACAAVFVGINPLAGMAQSGIRFDAASIKLAPPQALPAGYTILGPGSETFVCFETRPTADPIMLRAPCITLRGMILAAYSLQPYQLQDDGDWKSNEKYSLEATASHPTNYTEMMLMLQEELVDKFQLKMATSTRTVKALALVVGKSGTSFKQHDSGGAGPEGDARELSKAPTITFRTINDLLVFLNLHSSYGNRGLLNAPFDLPIIDKTGLAGEYDIALKVEGAFRAGAGWGIVGNVDYKALLNKQLGLDLVETTSESAFYSIETATAIK